MEAISLFLVLSLGAHPEHEAEAIRHLEKLGAKLTELSGEQAAYIGVPQSGPFKAEHYRY